MQSLPSGSLFLGVARRLVTWGKGAAIWGSVFAWLTGTALGGGVYYGDIDGDGSVTVADLVRLSRHLDGSAVLSTADLVAADANRDGKVDAADLQALRDTILGKRAVTLLPDSDGDGLPDAYEITVGLDPHKADTNGNGIKDGDDDLDGDGLTNRQEMLLGTNPRKVDTDGDGWSDEAEVAAGSDPLDPNDTPRFAAIARPQVRMLAPAFGGLGVRLEGTFVAAPRSAVLIPAPAGGVFAGGTWLASPIVRALVAAGPGSDPHFGGIYLARPPLKVVAPAAISGSSSLGTFVAKPPVKAKLNGP